MTKKHKADIKNKKKNENIYETKLTWKWSKMLCIKIKLGNIMGYLSKRHDFFIKWTSFSNMMLLKVLLCYVNR